VRVNAAASEETSDDAEVNQVAHNDNKSVTLAGVFS
jgi:hypothetical protein